MPALPAIMVAPNGARRTKADHAAIPVSIAELVAVGRDCFRVGAGAMHAHVRDGDQAHVLDAGLYRELIREMATQVPGMTVQITTEAVGRYTPAEQRRLVADVMPKMASVAVREMLADGETGTVRDFYHTARESGTAIQHILYTPDELDRFAALARSGFFAADAHQLLFVLGRHSRHGESNPDDLSPFLVRLESSTQQGLAADWAVCAFGRNETACLAAAFAEGGKVRVGFENSLQNADGTLATDNAERVREIARLQSDRH